MKTENKNDRTEFLCAQLAELRSHGGKLSLPCDSYDISASLVLDSSSSCIEGDVWSCNTDPNGVLRPTTEQSSVCTAEISLLSS